MLDPHADLGLGSVHFPELEIVGASNDTGDTVLRHRAEAGLGRRGMALTSEVAQRLDDELEVIAKLGYATYFLTVADVVDLIRDMGVRVAARGSGAGSLVNYLLGISGVDPMRTACSWSGSSRRCGRRCPTSTSTSSPPGAPRSTSGSSPGTAASGARACR